MQIYFTCKSQSLVMLYLEPVKTEPSSQLITQQLPPSLSNGPSNHTTSLKTNSTTFKPHKAHFKSPISTTLKPTSTKDLEQRKSSLLIIYLGGIKTNLFVPNSNEVVEVMVLNP